MRELVLVRFSLRELSALPWVALGGVLLVLAVMAGTQGIASSPGEWIGEDGRSAGNATGWALAGLLPAALWGGIAASGPSNLPHLLCRPLSRTRILVVRLLVVAVIVAGVGAIVGLATRSLVIEHVNPLTTGVVVTMLCHAVVSGAMARCLRADEPFAMAIGVLLLGLAFFSLSLPVAFVGVGSERLFMTLGSALVPVCTISVVAAAAPLVRHWRLHVPVSSPRSLAQAVGLHVGVLVLQSLVLWCPVAIWANLPQSSSPVAVLGRAPDGRMWVATGAPPVEAARGAKIDGLVLLDRDARTVVAGWFGGASLVGLGHAGEVVELHASPDGRAVAVVTHSDDTACLELHGVDGPLDRRSRPLSSGSARRLYWAPGSRALVDVVATAGALDVLRIDLEGTTAVASHALVAGERGSWLGWSGPRAWLRRGNAAVALDRSGRVAAELSLSLPLARLAPAGGGLASWDPASARLELSNVDRAGDSPLRVALPPRTAGIRSVVWLDADHVAILLSVDVDEDPSHVLVLHVGGEVLVDLPASELFLDELHGPPSGPWILRSGTRLVTMDRHGDHTWELALPTITANMVPTTVVHDHDGVLYVDHQGVIRERGYPWWRG